MKDNFNHSELPAKYVTCFLITSSLFIGSTISAIADNSSDPLMLHQAIETALENNPTLTARKYEKDAASARQDMASSMRLPHVNLYSAFGRYNDDRLITPRRPGGANTLQFTDQPLMGDLIIRIPLFTGGQLINESRAAKLLHDASGHRITRNREELIFNVSSVFYNILAQHHAIEALEFSRETLQKHGTRIKELIHAKKAAKVDLLRTEVRLSDLEQRLTYVKNILAIQNRLLTNLMGIPYTAKGNLIVTGQLEPSEEPVPDIEKSLNKALISRPDYLAAKATLSARDREIRVAQGLRSPDFSVKGSIGNTWDTHDFDQNNETGSIMLEMNLSIFSGGYVSAKIREKKANQSVALETLRQLEFQIQLDVETSILNLGSSYERICATGKSIEQAKESLRIEREKHAYAKGSIIDVLDAQSALLEAQMNYYRSLADYKTAQAQYQLATGENS